METVNSQTVGSGFESGEITNWWVLRPSTMHLMNNTKKSSFQVEVVVVVVVLRMVLRFLDSIQFPVYLPVPIRKAGAKNGRSHELQVGLGGIFDLSASRTALLYSTFCQYVSSWLSNA